MVEIPYSECELRCALNGLNVDKSAVDEVKDGFKDELLIERKELNKKIAEFHGISVEILVNSQNYIVLCDEYWSDMLERFVDKLVEKIGITHVQAYALAASGLGMI